MYKIDSFISKEPVKNITCARVLLPFPLIQIEQNGVSIILICKEVQI